MSHLLGVELQIINQDLIDLVTASGHLEPVARVDLYNASTLETVEITDIKSFSITKSSTNNDSFSLVVGDASTWHARTTDHADELAGYKNYWFKFSLGYTIDGTDVLIPYFIGVANQIPEDYGPTSEAITINGTGLSRLLQIVDGDLTNRTDDVSALIQELIDTSILEYSFVTLPTKSTDSLDLNNDDALSSIDYLRAAVGVATERYVNNEGVFVVQGKQDGVSSEFSYTGDAIFTLNRSFDASKLVTVCTVKSSAVSATVSDATGYLTNYGKIKKTISNNIITTYSAASAAARSAITNSISRSTAIRIKVPFNPYLTPGGVITVTEDERSLTGDDIYIETVTATCTLGVDSASTISGYLI